MTNQHEDTVNVEKENNHIFNSVDFQKFLHNQNAGGSFFTASKDDSSSFPTFETFDSHSGLGIYSHYSSLGGSSDFWQSMKDLQQQQQSLPDVDEKKKKKTTDSPSSDLTTAAATTTTVMANGISKEDRFRSNDWVTMKNLGNHVDVSYNQEEMFRCCDESSSSTTSSSGDNNNKRKKLSSSSSESLTTTGGGTNWEDLFYAQIQQHNAGGAEDAFRIPSRDDEQQQEQQDTTPPPAAVATKTKKKRSRKPRSKLEPPKNKVYVVPTDIDILMGRGGKSNNHPGNKRYREEVQNFRQSYNTLSDKDDKTNMSRLVVETIKSTGARFLELDRTNSSWYVVSDIKVRRKVSQALREDDDPAKRAAKRQRFLRKRRATIMMK